MEILRHFAKGFSCAGGRDRISNLEPHRLTSHLEVSRPNTFSDLAAELLLSITDFLPPEDICCLSLCDRRLCTALGGRRKREKLAIASRLSVLNRLEQDNPEYFTCYSCYALHRHDRASESFRLSGPIYQQMPQSKLCYAQTNGWRCDPELRMCIYSENSYTNTYNKFCFLHLQLVMKQYHYGPRYGISVSALSFTEVKIHVTSTALRSLEAQICVERRSPVFCLRIQDIMSGKDLRADGLLSDKKGGVPPRIYQICAHIRDDRLLVLIEDFVKAYRERRTLSLLRGSCNKCNTEYQLEMREFGKSNIAFMMTRWINLGTGRHPGDPRWKVHSLGSQHTPLTLGSDYILSSPRSLFEASHTAPLEELCTQNLGYLADRRYRSVMKQLSLSPPTWGLWHEPL